MAINYAVRSVGDRLDLFDLRDFIRIQDLNYPAYHDWVDSAMVQVELGFKKAILAFENGSLVGDILYQPHKELSRFREIKNLRLHPDVQGRGLASFLLKLAETEDADSIDALIIDARSDATDMNAFLLYSGFHPILGAPLYDKNEEEIVYLKPLSDKISQSQVISHFPYGKLFK